MLDPLAGIIVVRLVLVRRQVRPEPVSLVAEMMYADSGVYDS